jgi:hypothetical protein
MGVPGRRSGRVTRPALLALAAGGAAVLAAGCGSQAAITSSATQPASPGSASTSTPGTSPGSPGSTALCSHANAVTRLVVSRVSALPQNHLHFAFRAGITVTSPARARAVAEAVCALPPSAAGVMHCPADLGIGYRLSFAEGSRTFPVVTAAAGGCASVAGAGPVRTAARSPGFWTVLAHAMGVSTGAALRGTRPVSQSASPAG